VKRLLAYMILVPALFGELIFAGMMWWFCGFGFGIVVVALFWFYQTKKMDLWNIKSIKAFLRNMDDKKPRIYAGEGELPIYDRTKVKDDFRVKYMV